MAESVKAVCVLVMAIAAITASIYWFVVEPGPTTWKVRIVSTGLALLAFAILLRLQLRKDLVPDYLSRVLKNYFNRDGFCFGVVANNIDGVCHWVVYFQNQYENACVGRIAIRPNKNAFSGEQANVETVLIEVHCEPAAFGKASVPVALPWEVQGTKQHFDVGAAVTYPKGKGQRLRFRDGIFLRANTNFQDAIDSASFAANVLTGSFSSLSLSRPAGITVYLPDEVAEELPEGLAPVIETHWKLGDPPLE